MADIDLQAIHDVMVSVAYEAGGMMLGANTQDIDTGTKLNCEMLWRDQDVVMQEKT